MKFLLRFLFWGAIACSLIGLLCSATSLILRQVFDMTSVVTTVVSVIDMAVDAAVLTFTLMIRRFDFDNELQ